MILYRITREKYARDLSGRGGLMTAARWHDHLPAIYTSVNSSTCILEKFVQLLPDEIHNDLVICSFSIPENIGSEMLTIKQLPLNWRAYPAPAALQRIGNAWLLSKSSALLFVPSVIDPFAQNVLINTLHPDAIKIIVEKVTPFRFDPRMGKC